MYPDHATTALLAPPRLGQEHLRPEPADVVRTEREPVQVQRTARDAGPSTVPAGAVTPPPVRGTARSHPAPDDPFGAWIRRARAAGHPVQALGPGRYRPDNLMPMWSWSMPPNDLLDAAREVARRNVQWVHALLPDQAALLALHRCVVSPPPRGRRRRAGGPTATPWRRLVAQQDIGLCAISDTRGGVTTHVLEIPTSWLACPVIRIGPPAPPQPAPALPAERDEGAPLGDPRPVD